MCIHYTDYHDVDEELTIICKCGGRWNDGAFVGIASRDLYDSPTVSGDWVASLKNKN